MVAEFWVGAARTAWELAADRELARERLYSQVVESGVGQRSKSSRDQGVERWLTANHDDEIGSGREPRAPAHFVSPARAHLTTPGTSSSLKACRARAMAG